MKVLFIVRASYDSNFGGDTVQVNNTAMHLRRKGVSVDICKTDETINYEAYDLIHFFNITRPADMLIHIRKSKKPYVVSTIYVDYAAFDKNERKGFSGKLFRLISQNQVEYAKTIGRALVNGQRIVSPEYLWRGQKRSIRNIIRKSSCLLPNSASEYRRLSKDYQLEHKHRIVPNGIDPEVFFQAEDEKKENDMVICVARIEGIKNQLNLIRALNDSSFRLYIIGDPAKNQYEYYESCKSEAAKNIFFISHLSQNELKDYYRRAKVHVLPSWFETTGLSSLEAAAMGCSLVISEGGDTRSYFENNACYCIPSSPDSILEAVEKASKMDASEALKKKIEEEFNWKQTAMKTLEAYEAVIQNASI
jgi:glycosyltransferase involved in cell wall biosynthesis